MTPGVPGSAPMKFSMEKEPAQYTWAKSVNAQLLIGFGAL